jgi:hypothetical protein
MCVGPTLAPAQTATFTLSRPNCHVLAPHTENPFDYTHYYVQPALVWDAEAALVSLGSGVLLAHAGAPRWIAAMVPAVGFGLVPHLVGWRLGQYQIDVAHWAFVAWNRSTPAFWAYGARDDSTHRVQWQHHARAAGLWLAGDLALTCFDR